MAAATVAVSRCAAGIDTLLLKQFTTRGALGASDRLAFYRQIEPSASSHSAFYPGKVMPKVTTEAAIDTFLDNYGAPVDPEEQAMLEKLIFNPVADYSSVLKNEQGDEAPHAVDSQDAMLDAFLAKTAENGVCVDNDKHKLRHESPEEGSDRNAPAPQPSSLLSESLARIYVKRGRYDKAYEIIHNLSLNFPEKSIYFADQLRFLQKLMVNSKYSNPQK